MMWVKWKLISTSLEIVLSSTQYRCMVCAECTTGKEIFLPHSMDLLGGVGQMKACFGPFGDSVNKHTIKVQGLHRT
jgi:hypothetical protein